MLQPPRCLSNPPKIYQSIHTRRHGRCSEPRYDASALHHCFRTDLTEQRPTCAVELVLGLGTCLECGQAFGGRNEGQKRSARSRRLVCGLVYRNLGVGPVGKSDIYQGGRAKSLIVGEHQDEAQYVSATLNLLYPRCSLCSASFIHPHIDEPLPSNVDLLPSNHPHEAYRIAIQQLQLADAVVNAVAPYLQLLVETETVGYNNGPDAAAFQHKWGNLQDALSRTPYSSQREFLKPLITPAYCLHHSQHCFESMLTTSDSLWLAGLPTSSETCPFPYLPISPGHS